MVSFVGAGVVGAGVGGSSSFLRDKRCL